MIRHYLLNLKGKNGKINYKLDAEKYRYTSNVDLDHTEDFAYITPSPFNSGESILASGTDLNESNNLNEREQ